MMTVHEIPLTPEPQRFSIQLGSKTYELTLWWNDSAMGGWMLDIADNSSVAIVSGIPLVTGADLLAQYGYLGFEGKLIVQTEQALDAVPTYTNLGTTSHLYFTTSP